MDKISAIDFNKADKKTLKVRITHKNTPLSSHNHSQAQLVQLFVQAPHPTCVTLAFCLN